jgi:hypothetical protein
MDLAKNYCMLRSQKICLKQASRFLESGRTAWNKHRLSPWRAGVLFSMMSNTPRQPKKNIAFTVYFIISGAHKRRSISYAKARQMQAEIGIRHISAVSS